VVVPEEFMGDIIGDLNSRRPHPVDGQRAAAPRSSTRAPLSEMLATPRNALADPGPRHLLDAFRSLRAGAEPHQ
jgi:hypothetical protein